MEKKKENGFKERKDIPEKYTWRLSDIFSSDEAWEKSLKEVALNVKAFQQYQGKLATSAKVFQEALDAQTKIEMDLSELYSYAQMNLNTDNGKAFYQDMSNRMLSFYYQCMEQMSFFLPEVTKIPTAVLEGWLDEEKALEIYRHGLEDLIRGKAHILSDKEEVLFAKLGPAISGVDEAFSYFNNVDLDFGSLKNAAGETVKLTHASFGQFRESKNRTVRAEAFQKIHTCYGQFINTMAALYATSVKANVAAASARGYESALAGALFSDNLPAAVVQNLIAGVHEYQPVMDDYFEFRKKQLNLTELHIYDTYIPLIEMPNRTYTYEEATEMVCKALEPLGEDYLEKVKEHLHNRWIDVFETKGKTSGAYSTGTYRTHPYILLNFDGTLNSVFTLIHEIGHSIHTYYSAQRPFVQAHYPIVLAEIASTVNENLLLDYLLKHCDEETTAGRKEKQWLLNYRLEGFRLTVFRQTMFAEFEKQAHEILEANGALTADTLSTLYAQLLKQYFGATVIDDYMHYEWARIPHFYSAFYVFKYATGYTTAVSISQKILQAGESERQKYIEFLKAGGSDYPLQILEKLDIDFVSGAVVEEALKLMEETLKSIKQMTE